MSDLTGIDWEDAFANADYIPDGMGYPDRWAARAAAYRQQTPAELDLSYGPGPRNRLDLFFPDGPPKGLAMIVHGGYWVAFDKSSWSDLAEGARALGWAVAMPSYTLAPDASLPEITAEIATALQFAAGKVQGPIHLAGHSAGGHLVCRMGCTTAPLSADVGSRIKRIVSISGLHDLRPLQGHSMNTKLRLTRDIATTESPALLTPRPGPEVTAWVGARERPEFLRQSALLTEAWGEQGLNTQLIADPGRHHFDVIDGLKSPEHPLTQAFVGA